MRYVCLLALVLSGLSTQAQDGAAVYKQHCALCHDAPAGRVPPVSAIRAMGIPRVLNALEQGTMKAVGDTLTSQERYAVALYLSFPPPKEVPVPPSAFCKVNTQPFKYSPSGPRWSGWSTDTANTRFQDAAGAGLTPAEVSKLKLKWAFGLGNETDARSQPAVADGRIFFGTTDGTVYSLDARSGCIYWTSRIDGGIHSAVTVGEARHGKGAAVYFGSGPNAYALDAATGKLLWKVRLEHHFAASITAAPLLHRGVLYFTLSSFEEALPPLPTYQCCTFRGSVVALKANLGKRIWKTYTVADAPQPTEKNKAGAQMYGPSGASVWSTPTFDEKRNVVYVATGDNYSAPATQTSDAVLAMNAKTGKLLWSRQITSGDAYNDACGFPGSPNCPKPPGQDLDFGEPPILVSLENGRRALLIGQKSGVASALDPDKQGEVLWQTRVGKGGAFGGIQWGSAADAQNMYVALSDLHIKGVVADATSPQGYRLQLDPHQGGGLFALRVSSGQQVWNAKPSSSCGDRTNCSPAQSAAVAAIPGVIFSGSVDGHVRAYAAATGEIIWDEDTAHDYDTLNGQHAHGGSLDGPGPVIVDGMLFVNSGYGQWGGMPGNVLLAFSVDGR